MPVRRSDGSQNPPAPRPSSSEETKPGNAVAPGSSTRAAEPRARLAEVSEAVSDAFGAGAAAFALTSDARSWVATTARDILKHVRGLRPGVDAARFLAQNPKLESA